MFCPRCLDSGPFQQVRNIIHAASRFRRVSLSPGNLTGPDLRCVKCGLIFQNHGTHLEALG